MAVTVWAALIVMVQGPLPDQSLFQPAKVKSAVAVSWVGRVKAQRCPTGSAD
jgi:hypothetical protein